jgi:hypothetical protein
MRMHHYCFICKKAITLLEYNYSKSNFNMALCREHQEIQKKMFLGFKITNLHYLKSNSFLEFLNVPVWIVILFQNVIFRKQNKFCINVKNIFTIYRTFCIDPQLFWKKDFGVPIWLLIKKEARIKNREISHCEGNSPFLPSPVDQILKSLILFFFNSFKTNSQLKFDS